MIASIANTAFASGYWLLASRTAASAKRLAFCQQRQQPVASGQKHLPILAILAIMAILAIS
jgi:hypothetical protein